MRPGTELDIDDIDAALAAAFADPDVVKASTPKARRDREKRHALRPDDGRRKRATGRTAQFNVKQRPDVKRRVIQACKTHDKAIAEFVEGALLAALEKLERKGSHA